MAGPTRTTTKEVGSRGSADRRQRKPHGAGQNRRAQTADSATLEEQCHPRKIFVGGLAHKTSTQQLRDHFVHYGPIVDAVVLQWPDGRSRGFGYVTFSDASHADAALNTNHQVDGRQVDTKRAVPGTNKLFVGGLPQNTSAAELRVHFETFGVVSDAVVMIDPATSRSRGFGFVCFAPGPEGAAAVQSCLAQYQGHRIRGKWIEVKTAAPPHKLGDGGKDSSVSEAGAPPGLEVGMPSTKVWQSSEQAAPSSHSQAVRGYAQRQEQWVSRPAYEPCKVALPNSSTATMQAAYEKMGCPLGLAPLKVTGGICDAETSMGKSTLSFSLQQNLEELLRQQSCRLEASKKHEC